MSINKPKVVLFGANISAFCGLFALGWFWILQSDWSSQREQLKSGLLSIIFFGLFTHTAHASLTQLELSCNLIPLDYPGFSLDDIQERTVMLDAANPAAKPLFTLKGHTFIVGVNRTDITDIPHILDFYLQVQPPAPAAPVRAFSASYFSPGTGKHHSRLELLHYGDKAEPYPSGQLVFECQQYQ